MKIYISVDGEGASGVVTPIELRPNNPFCGKMMTLDVNAAVKGAFDAGATEVIINDAHWNDNNIDIELLDQRVSIMRGGNKPLGMVDSIEGYDAAFFIAYHAMAGRSNGVGNETNWGREVVEVRMNNVPVGEAEINAAIAGDFGVPVIMVSGDDCFCKEISSTLKKVETAIVKKAINRFSATCLSLELAHERIYKASRESVSNIGKYMPYRVKGPVEIETVFMSTAEAHLASLMPGTKRKDYRTVSYTGKNATEAYKGCQAYQTLGCVASDEIYG